MKRSREESANTRRQIVQRASAEFRRNGIDGRGIAAIMSDLGLTHGGFYRHFDSKEALAEEALQAAFESLLGNIEARMDSPGPHGLAALVDGYLSTRHMRNFENACPLAALGSELRRADGDIRGVAGQGMERLIRIVRSCLAGMDARQAGSVAVGIVSSLVGGMTLARLAADPKAADKVLEQTREFILDRAQVTKGELNVKNHRSSRAVTAVAHQFRRKPVSAAGSNDKDSRNRKRRVTPDARAEKVHHAS